MLVFNLNGVIFVWKSVVGNMGHRELLFCCFSLVWLILFVWWYLQCI